MKPSQLNETSGWSLILFALLLAVPSLVKAWKAWLEYRVKVKRMESQKATSQTVRTQPSAPAPLWPRFRLWLALVRLVFASVCMGFLMWLFYAGRDTPLTVSWAAFVAMMAIATASVFQE